MKESDKDLVAFLSDPNNVYEFLATATVMSLGFVLTEDGKWSRIST